MPCSIIYKDDNGNEYGFDDIMSLVEFLKNNPSVLETQAAESTEAPSGASTADTKAPLVIKGENISTKGDAFLRKLTNPGNDLDFIYKGKQYKNSEHAYQTWKSGQFDKNVYENGTGLKFYFKGAKPVNIASSFNTMVDVLTAKLKAHPELVRGITERGGVEWLKASSHNVTNKANDFWEGQGEQSGFIRAMIEAYEKVTSPTNTTSTSAPTSFTVPPSTSIKPANATVDDNKIENLSQLTGTFKTGKQSVYTIQDDGRVSRYKVSLLEENYAGIDKGMDPNMKPTDILVFVKSTETGNGNKLNNFLNAGIEGGPSTSTWLVRYDEATDTFTRIDSNKEVTGDPNNYMFLILPTNMLEGNRLSKTFKGADFKKIEEAVKQNKLTHFQHAIFRVNSDELSFVPKMGYHTIEWRVDANGTQKGSKGHVGNKVIEINTQPKFKVNVSKSTAPAVPTNTIASLTAKAKALKDIKYVTNFDSAGNINARQWSNSPGREAYYMMVSAVELGVSNNTDHLALIPTNLERINATPQFFLLPVIDLNIRGEVNETQEFTPTIMIKDGAGFRVVKKGIVGPTAPVTSTGSTDTTMTIQQLLKKAHENLTPSTFNNIKSEVSRYKSTNKVDNNALASQELIDSLNSKIKESPKDSNNDNRDEFSSPHIPTYSNDDMNTLSSFANRKEYDDDFSELLHKSYEIIKEYYDGVPVITDEYAMENYVKSHDMFIQAVVNKRKEEAKEMNSASLAQSLLLENFKFPILSEKEMDYLMKDNTLYYLLEGFDSYFFEIYRNLPHHEKLSKSRKASDIYGEVRNKLRQELLTGDQDLLDILVNKLLGDSNAAIANFKAISEFHEARLKKFKINVKEDVYEVDETDAGRDHVHDRDAIQYDTKDMMPPAVKIFIAGGKVLNSEGYPIINSLGYPLLSDFNQVYNYIGNRLANIPNDISLYKKEIDALIKHLTSRREAANDAGDTDYKDYYTDTLQAIRDAIDYNVQGELNPDSDPQSHADADNGTALFINKMITTLSKFTPAFFTQNLKDSTVENLNLNGAKLRNKVKYKLSSAIPLENDTNSSYTPGKVIDEVIKDLDTYRAKSINSNDIKALAKILKKVGIVSDNMVDNAIKQDQIAKSENFTSFRDFVNKTREVMVKYRELHPGEKIGKPFLTYLLNSVSPGSQEYKTLKDTYLTRDQNAFSSIGKVVDRFIDAEVAITDSVVNNQAVNIEGNNIHGITLNHSISRNTTNINYVARQLRDNEINANEVDRLLDTTVPLLNSAWGRNSRIRSLIKTTEGKVNLTPTYVDGVLVNGKGTSFHELQPSERLAAIINGTLRDTMFFFRAADRNVEAATKITIDGVPSTLLGSTPTVENGKQVLLKYYEDELVTRVIANHLDTKYLYYHVHAKDAVITNNGANPRFFEPAKFASIHSGFKTVESEIKEYMGTVTSTTPHSEIRSKVQSIINANKNTLGFELSEYVKKRADEIRSFAEEVGTIIKNPSILTGTNSSIAVGIDSKYLSNGAISDQTMQTFAILSEINYIEQSKVFAGDPMFYSNADDWFKRMKVTTSNFKDSVVSEEYNQFLENTSYITFKKGDTYYKVKSSDLTYAGFEMITEGKAYDNIPAGPTIDLKFGPGFRIDRLKSKRNEDPNKTNRSLVNTISLDDVESKSSFLDGVEQSVMKSVHKIDMKGTEAVYTTKQGTEIAINNDYVNFMAKRMYEEGNRGKVLATKLKAHIKTYMELTEQDGESYITIHAYRDLLQRNEGVWTLEHEKAYVKMVTGKTLTDDDKALFRKLKTLGSNNLAKLEPAGSETPTAPLVYKHSLQPIHPALVGKDTNLARLHDFMESNNVHMAIYISANKVGQIRTEKDGKYLPHSLYSEKNGKAVVDFTNATDTKPAVLNGKTLVTQTSSWSNFGIQVDMKPIYKDKVTAGSQWRKLVLSNMMSNGKPGDFKGTAAEWDTLTKNLDKLDNDQKEVIYKKAPSFRIIDRYLNVQAALYEKTLNELIKEIDLKTVNNAYVIGNKQKLVDVLVDMAISRDYTDNVIRSIIALQDEGNYVEYLIDSDKIENVLFAIVNSRIIKEKRNGTGAPQAAVTGFEYSKNARDFNNGRLKTNDEALKFYRRGKDGTTQPAEVMFRIPDTNDFKMWFEEHFKSDLDALNSALDGLFGKYYANEENDVKIVLSPLEQDLENVIKLIGFRIPTQGMNSGDMLRIRRFLPLHNGDTIVVPSGIVGKAGSDFDIDKLSIYLMNFKYSKGRLVSPTVDYDNSTVEDRYDEYVNNYILDKEAKTSMFDELKSEEDYMQLSEGLSVLKNERNDLSNSIKALNDIKENKKLGIDTFKSIIRPFGAENNILRSMFKAVEDEYDSQVHRLNGFINAVSDLEEILNNINTYIDNDNDAISAIAVKFNEFDSSEKNAYKSKLDLLVKYYENSLGEYLSPTDMSAYRKMKENKASTAELKEKRDDMVKEYKKGKITEEGGYSFEEFSRLPFHEQFTNKQLQNHMIELTFEALSLESNFRSLMSPISDSIITDTEIGYLWDVRFLESGKTSLGNHLNEFMKEKKDIVNRGLDLAKTKELISDSYDKHKDAFVKAYKDVKASWSDVIKVETNVKKALYFLTGKTGVGQAAVHVTNHKLATDVGLHFGVTGENMLLFFEHNTRDGLMNIGDVLSKDGNVISDVLSALVNAYVDVAKDPFIFDLNAGRENANMQFLMVRLGIPGDVVYSFMNQPIIKEFQKLKGIYDNNTARSLGRVYHNQLMSKAINNIHGVTNNADTIKTVFIDGTPLTLIADNNTLYPLGYVNTNKYLKMFRESVKGLTNNKFGKPDWKGGMFTAKQDKFNEDTMKAINGEKGRNRAGEVNGKFLDAYKKLAKLDNLRDLIVNPKSKVTDMDPKVQSAIILDMYMILQDMAQITQAMIRGSSADTKGMGKTLSTTNKMIAEKKMILATELFKNYDKMISNTIVKVPSKVTETFQTAYDEIMVYQQDSNLRNLSTGIIEAIKKQKNEYNPQVIDKISSLVRSRITQSLIVNTVDEFKPSMVFNDLMIPNNRNSNPKHSLIRIIRDKISVVENLNIAPNLLSILDFKINAGLYFKDYRGFTSKYYLSDTSPGFDYIAINAEKIPTITANDLTSEMRKLRDSNNKTANKLYEVLLRLGITAHAYTNSTISFHNLLPEEDVRILKKHAFKEYMSMSDDNKVNWNDVFRSRFANSFINSKTSPSASDYKYEVVREKYNENNTLDESNDYRLRIIASGNEYSRKFVREGEGLAGGSAFSNATLAKNYNGKIIKETVRVLKNTVEEDGNSNRYGKHIHQMFKPGGDIEMDGNSISYNNNVKGTLSTIVNHGELFSSFEVVLPDSKLASKSLTNVKKSNVKDC